MYPVNGEASRGGWGDEVNEMLNTVANERQRLEENEGFAEHCCGLPSSFLGLWLGLRTIKPTHGSSTASMMVGASRSKAEATVALEEGDDVIS